VPIKQLQNLNTIIMATPKNKFINGQLHIKIGIDNKRAPIYEYVNNEEIINSIIKGDTKYYRLFDEILDLIRKEKKEIDFVKKILNKGSQIRPELFLKLLRTMKNENKNKIQTELTKDEKYKLFNFLSKYPNYEIIKKLIKTPEGESILVKFLSTSNKNKFINTILKNPRQYINIQNLFKKIFKISHDNNKTLLITKLLDSYSYNNLTKRALFRYLLNDESVKNSLVKIIQSTNNRKKKFQKQTNLSLSNNVVKPVPKPPPPTLPIKSPEKFVSGEYTEQMGKETYYDGILKTKNYSKIPSLYNEILKENSSIIDKNKYYKKIIERPNLPQPVRIELMRKKAHNELFKRLENLKKSTQQSLIK